MRNILSLAGSALALFTSVANATPAVLAARAPPSGYTYRGCYTDIVGFRVLPIYIGTSVSGMTLDKCAIACADYAYFGTELGNQCFCGNAIGTFPPPIPVLDSLCVLPCVGNVLAGNPLFDQICGGPTQISIYQKNAGTIPPVPAIPTYNPIGCYSQAVAGTPLSDSVFTLPSGLTVQTCQALCAGFPYFGLQNGNTCTCGNTIGAGAYIQLPATCSAQCNGNAAQTCGGPFTVNIYAAPTSPGCNDLGTPLRIQNPGFENGMAFWTSTVSSPSDIQWQAINFATPHTGRRVARVTSKSTAATLTLGQSTTICAGAGYILSIWAMEDPLSVCSITVSLAGSTFTAGSTNTWVQHQIYVSSTTASNPLSMVVQCLGSATFKRVYIDDVQLRPAVAADSALFPP